MLSDEQLEDLFRKDRREGLRLTYVKYADGLYSVCRRYAVDDQEAQDFFHDAMLRVYDKAGAFRSQGEGSLLRWMSRVAVNMIVDGMRKKRNVRLLSMEEAVIDVPEPSPEQASMIPVEEMRRMIGSLSPVKKMVFNLFCIESYSHKEIGKMLGITEEGSSSTLSKARKELAAMVNEYIKRRG